MAITHMQLLHGCLLSSIAHAIMSNIYPELVYEQSWDGLNFSVVGGNGKRGTISFTKDFCVGAIRSCEKKTISGMEEINHFIQFFPEQVRETANNETIQYLLDNVGGDVIPSISSVFYCDQRGIHFPEDCSENFEDDFSLFYLCSLPDKEAIDENKKYYNMDAAAVYLLETLLQQKKDNPCKKIVLDRQQIMLIPGEEICQECIESLAELNIFLDKRSENGEIIA